MLLLRTSRGVDPGIPLLRSLGSNAHVWLPGASGVSVASLPSNNYLLSDGSTGYSTVDGVDGLTLDGMGSVGAEKVTNGGFATDIAGWTQVDVGAGGGIAWSAGRIAITGTSVANYSSARQTLSLTVGKTYLITFTVSGINAFVDATGPVPFANYPVGTHTMYVVAGAAQTLSFAPIGGVGTVYVDNISVKEYTGTHLTQATTANKPLVRRGMLNLLTYSNDLMGAGWAASNAARLVDQDGTADLVYPNTTGVGCGVYKAYATGVIPCTVAFLVKPAGFTNIAIVDLSGVAHAAWFNLTTVVASNVIGGYTASIASQANGYYLCVISGTGTATSFAQFSVVDSAGSNTATANGTNGVYVANVGLFAGTFSAAQILAEGGIPTTTATAASNPSAGKYWWSFDGSNDSLLSGNLGITNACTIVIAGRVNSLAATQMLFAEDANGVQVNIDATGRIVFGKIAVAEIVDSNAGAIVAGVPFVIIARLSSGTAVLRLNGVQIDTVATGYTFSATTGARIGTYFNGFSLPTNGAIGWVVALPVALSDADCLTVERLVSSQFPNGPVF